MSAVRETFGGRRPQFCKPWAILARAILKIMGVLWHGEPRARASVQGERKNRKSGNMTGRAWATHLLWNFVKGDASFFHPPAFRFWLGQSVGCIRPNKKLEKDKHVRARRRIGQKTARFFSLTSCALLGWEEPALYKVQRKV